MKMTTRITPVVVILTLVLTAALAACSVAAAPPPQAQNTSSESQTTADPPAEPLAAPVPEPSVELTTADDEGNTSIVLTELQDSLPTTTGDLTDAEIASLLYMREEEKLARDVYLALYDSWGMRTFQNIANSEQSHMEAVKSLLDEFGLDDPATDKAAGEFSDADLQALYDQLTATGEQSLEDALKVGALIEEMDILDLEDSLAMLSNPSLRTVYENLLKGSRNHLRAFTSTLNRQTGEVYEPEYLSVDAYQSIVGSEIEAGGNRRGGNRNRS